jgi:dihydrolipoamide dehydrogenase
VEAGSFSDPRDLVDSPRVPESAVVVGGGRGGVELAGLLAAAGSAVTLLESGPALLPDADADVSASVRRALEAHGVVVGLSTRATAVERAGPGVRVEASGPAGDLSFGADAAFAATGREPDDDGTGGAEGLEGGRQRRLRTGEPWLFRAGAAAGGSLSEERAWREGRAAVAWALGEPEALRAEDAPVLVDGVGGCGWVGLSEDAARAQGLSPWVGRASLPGAGAVGPGFVKLVGARGSDRIVGVHVLGPRGHEAVALGAVLVERGVSRLEARGWAFAPGSPADAVVEAASEVEER